MQRLLIAESSEEYRQSLARHLAGSYVIRCCSRGRETLDTICTFKPDLLVLDLMLPELDGISLLHEAAELGHWPIVLATTRFTNDYVERELTRLGAGYIMMKPCDVKATADRLKDLAGLLEPGKPARPDNRTVVCNALLALGIPTKLRGYTYLREAILAVMREPGQLVTKELYPAVARLCGASRDQVERSIRSAITTAYQNRNERVWREYFMPNAEGALVRPSNGAFITTIAARLTDSDRD